MKQYLALFLLVAPLLDASAGYYFTVPSRSTTRFGLGRMELIPRPDISEPEATAHEFCTRAATSALIRFDDGLRMNALSTLPESPVAPPELTKNFPDVLPLKASQTSYEFPQNRCVRGYDSSGPVLIDIPKFEDFFTGLMTCADMHGYDQVSQHAFCVEAIAEHREH
jgi:hypothetical protein